MRRILIGLLMLSVVPAANAEIRVSLTATGGFYLPGDPLTGFLDANSSGSSSVYLLWAGPDGTVDPPISNGNPTGDDQLIAGFSYNAADGSGSPYGNGWLQTVIKPYPGVSGTALIYLRIFQDTTPAAGEGYFDSALLLADDVGGLDPPQLLDANPAVGVPDSLALVLPSDACVPVDCDDSNPCTDDVCTVGVCSNPPNSAPCDDGDICTQTDLCAAGACFGGPPAICPPGDICVDVACVPFVGCTQTPNSAPCDDADACSVGDTCAAGACTPGTPLDCDDGFGCSQDLCNAALGCFYLPEADTTPCDDGLFCTENDACTNGGAECIGSAVDCTDNEPCTKDGCDALDGLCVHAPQAGPCDDGDACTSGDDCGSGVCAGGSLDCDDDNPCTDDSCDSAAGCTYANNTAGCDDGDACTLGDTCAAGSCGAGAGAPDCDDGNACSDDSCDPVAGCGSTPNAVACDDGLNCTFNDVCTTGDCLGEPVTCDDGEDCTKDGCDASDGLCVNAPISGPCNDGDACTENTTCETGECEGDDVECDDGDACTADSCDPATGCDNSGVAENDPCDDGDECTENDACDAAGDCVGGVVACDDSNPCTADSCDPGVGCVNDNMASGTSCADGDVCDGSETCFDGVCTAGAALNCNDGNVCTFNGCDPSTGCTSTDNIEPCSDNDFCNGDEVCAAGACEPGSPPDCGDGNQCTTDECDIDFGCQNFDLATGEDCDDGDACTDGDSCDAGSCVAGAPLACNDLDPCTDDACDSGTGCTTSFNTAPCFDFDECNGAEQCDGAGNCVAGTALVCDDGSACTVDSCDEAAGCQVANAAEGTACGDGDACNGDELCDAAGACAAGAAPDCDDGNACTDDSCDSASGCGNSNVASGTSCADGDACNGEETCLDGACSAGTALDCDDDDVCTTDACSATDGCTTEDIEDCCVEDDGCPDRGACMDVFCDTDANECDSSPIADCCLEDSECDDGNTGTDDSCDLSNNTCVNAPIGCQAEAEPDASCDDGDVCTNNTCGSDGVCTASAIANCCEVDTDCGDDEVCDTDINRCADSGVGGTGVDTEGDDDTFTDWGPKCSGTPGGTGAGGSTTLLILLAGLAFLGGRRRMAQLAAASLALSLVLVPGAAQADWPDQSVYLEIYGGAHLDLHEWDLNKVGNAEVEVGHSAVGGLRLGGYPVWWFGIEGDIGVLPLSPDDVGDNIAINGGVGLLFHFMKATWSPYATVGGGMYRNLDGDLGEDTDYNAYWGLGVVGNLNDWLGLRFQARHLLTDGNDGKPGLAHNLELTAALRFYLWRTEADRDKDGWMDIDDECPDTPGHDSARGCPDRDGDGIPDYEDKCPDTPGPKKHDGCPDRDGDGIIDMKDKCPDLPGVIELEGCKDTDGDGILDHVDTCPKEPEDKDGFEDEDGCPDPDNDKDKILDTVDKCPLKPETYNEYKDGDGCPDVPPVVVKDKEIIILDKVFFDTNKATIKPESFEVLNHVAKVLKQYPDIAKVQVGGHTDDVGSSGKNQRLSQRRAESVVKYLVDKGTDKRRLNARGYGEAKPLVKDTTDEARAQNRRVEFKILKRTAPK